MADTAGERRSVPVPATSVKEMVRGLATLSPSSVSEYEPAAAMPPRRTSVRAVAVTPVVDCKALIWSAVALAVALTATVMVPVPR